MANIKFKSQALKQNDSRAKPKKVRTCPVCALRFAASRSNQTYCGPRCKDTAKKHRKRNNPEFASKELEAKRHRYQKNVAECHYGFTAQDGYLGYPLSRPKPIRFEVDCVIDKDDDFAHCVSVTHPIPVWTVDEVNF